MVNTQDYEQLQLFSRHLGKYFEFIGRNTRNEATLEEEVQFTIAYMEIQQVRFAGRIRIEIGPLPDRFRLLSVPRLILQPIVENAYKYAIEQISADGLLKMSFTDDGRHAVVHIEDSGKGTTDETIDKIRRDLSSSSTVIISGIYNVDRRLKLKFGSEAGIQVSRSDFGGLKVSVFVPYSEGLPCTGL